MKALLFALVLFGSVTMIQKNQPTYISNLSKEIITKTLDAHGGMKAWKNAEVIKFHKIARPVSQDGKLPYSPWITVETVHKPSEQVLIELPIDNGLIIKTEKEVLYKGISDAKMQAANPAMLSLMTYKFTNLPWLTQQKGVTVHEVTEAQLPNENKTYHCIKITYDESFGYAIGDFYKLYIDPDTYKYKAVSFSVNMGQFVAGAGSSPEMVHVFKEYENIDGIVIPTQYETYRMGQEGNDIPFGATHDLWSVEFGNKFNHTMADNREGFEKMMDPFAGKGGTK